MLSSSAWRFWFGAAALFTLGGCDLFQTVTDPNHGANIGSACTDSASGGQSNCDPTQTCVPVSKQNMCTVVGCTADSDCGANGQLTNHCVPSGSSALCLRGCDPKVGNSCGRSDFICATGNAGATYNCLPDCRQQDSSFCSYPTLCSQTDGQCETVNCNSTSGCPTNTVCATVDQRSICVPNCKASGCPSGTMCNDSGGCDTVKHKLYEACGGTLGGCAAGLDCAQVGQSSHASCLQTCMSDSDCTSLQGGTTGTTTCGLQLQDGFNICVTQCNPQFTMCPAQTTCQVYDQINGINYCLP